MIVQTCVQTDMGACTYTALCPRESVSQPSQSTSHRTIQSNNSQARNPEIAVSSKFIVTISPADTLHSNRSLLVRSSF